MAHMNRKMAPGVDTVFFMTALEHAYLSSSLVREIARFGGDVAPLVPHAVLGRLAGTGPSAEGAPEPSAGEE
jgi:pantetheine-phosphate adenylyltransferase